MTSCKKFVAKMFAWGCCWSLAVLLGSNVVADVRLPAIFGDHMVLQQGQANPVWGWAEPGEKVVVSIAGQRHETEANNGQWRVELDSLPVGGPYELVVQGKNTVTLGDVLIGEVWLCSGQSNMGYAVRQANDPDLETLTAQPSQSSTDFCSPRLFRRAAG